jgi:hypothetical protein
MTTFRRFSLATVVAAALLMLIPEGLSAGRGGSFGGSRGGRGGSFGGSRGYRSTRPAPRSQPGGSFGGSRQSTSRTPSRSTPSTAMPRNSFGGTRMSSPQQYTSTYGTPRRTVQQNVPTSTGVQPMVINSYGGFGDRFMMGYLMGSIPWYYHMPFHPAYYYSAPYTAMGPNGMTHVYPGTFQWGTLFFSLLLIGGIAFIIYVVVRNRRRRSSSGVGDLSRSSFS